MRPRTVFAKDAPLSERLQLTLDLLFFWQVAAVETRWQEYEVLECPAVLRGRVIVARS